MLARLPAIAVGAILIVALLFGVLRGAARAAAPTLDLDTARVNSQAEPTGSFFDATAVPAAFLGDDSRPPSTEDVVKGPYRNEFRPLRDQNYKPRSISGWLRSSLLSRPAAAAPELISSAQLERLVGRAPAAIVTAYELPRRGGMTSALERLCRRGGRGDVILAGERFIIGARLRADVDAAAAALTQARCHVTRAVIPLHLKLVVLGRTTYLADRNFGRYATIIRLADPADRDLVAATLRNRPGTNGTLATIKHEALTIEAETIASSRGPLDVESESFGPDNPVYDALAAAAAGGRPVRLIVAASELRENARERRALSQLARRGVRIRSGYSDAKLAVSATTLWAGSSNATAGYPNQVDWGRRIGDPALRARIAQRFQGDWERARPF